MSAVTGTFLAFSAEWLLVGVFPFADTTKTRTKNVGNCNRTPAKDSTSEVIPSGHVQMALSGFGERQCEMHAFDSQLGDICRTHLFRCHII